MAKSSSASILQSGSCPGTPDGMQTSYTGWQVCQSWSVTATQVIAAAGVPKKDYLSRRITPQLEKLELSRRSLPAGQRICAADFTGRRC